MKSRDIVKGWRKGLKNWIIYHLNPQNNHNTGLKNIGARRQTMTKIIILTILYEN
jgi:hypothetical protein